MLIGIRVFADPPIPPLYKEPGLFKRAIAENSVSPVRIKISGIIVPHHLLVVDLMARTFGLIRENGYDRIIILSPDHFSRSKTPFAVCERNLQSCLGDVPVSVNEIRQLLKNELISASSLFSHEHGLQAILPFIAYFFPKVQVIPIAFKYTSKRRDWDSLFNSLSPIAGSGTLVVQSTDFSHFLPQSVARKKDQETLRVLAGGAASGVISLNQPGHVDSMGAFYLQMRIQNELNNAAPLMVDNRNSQEFTRQTLSNTTSYITALYSKEKIDIPSRSSPSIAGIKRESVFVFAGDTFFGRFMARKLRNPIFGPKLLEKAVHSVGSATLILNLEGVLLDNEPENPGPFKLSMESENSLGFLKTLNAKVIVLANNHAMDFGRDAYLNMKRKLEKAGFRTVGNKETMDCGPFFLSAFTDLDNSDPNRRRILSEKDFSRLKNLPRGKPHFAFVHWGKEYSSVPTDREDTIATWLKNYGVELIIGCHPHTASDFHSDKDFAEVFSLGNFLFDQPKPPSGGNLLEVRFFPQGTYFSRLIPIGNLYGEKR